jgi:hypothetical protein
MSIIVLGNASTDFDLEIPQVRRTAEGLDELRELKRAVNQQAYALGSQRSPLGITGEFYVQDARCVGCQFGRPIMEVISRGIANTTSTKPIIWEGTGYTDSVQTAPLTGWPGAGVGAFRGEVFAPRVGMTARYITKTAPSQAIVGTSAAPAVNYGTPPYPSLVVPTTDFFYHAPAGWILAKRDILPVAYTAFYFVTDYFMYQHSPTYAPS